MSAKVQTRTIITSEIDEQTLDEISAVYPLVSRHRIAQAALRCGLRTIRQDPARLVREARDVPETGATR